MQVALQQAPPLACAMLLLFSELLKHRPALWLMVNAPPAAAADDDEEHFADAPDPEDEAGKGVKSKGKGRSEGRGGGRSEGKGEGEGEGVSTADAPELVRGKAARGVHEPRAGQVLNAARVRRGVRSTTRASASPPLPTPTRPSSGSWYGSEGRAASE